MSSTNGDDVPRTPQRRTSSSFLTGLFNRQQHNNTRPALTPHASTSPATTYTPAQGTFTRRQSIQVATLRRTHSRNLSEETAHPTNEMVARPRPPNGPVDWNHLAHRLHKSSPIEDRISAANDTLRAIADFVPKDLRWLYPLAIDLINTTTSHDAVAAGYKLLAQYAAFPELKPLQRRDILADIHHEENTTDLDLQLNILVTLTDSGKTVEGLEDVIIPLLSRYLELAFKNAHEVRKKVRDTQRRKESEPVQKAEVLPRMVVGLLVNIVKFNSSILREDDIIMLVDQANFIWKNGTRADHMDFGTVIVDALFTHTLVPEECLEKCLGGLSNVCRQVEEKRSMTMETILKIMKSHYGPAGIRVLLNILHTGQKSIDRRANLTRGALYVLTEIMRLQGKDGLPEVRLEQLLPALVDGLQINSSKLANDALKLFDYLAGDTPAKLVELLPEEHDWQSFLAILDLCAHKHWEMMDRLEMDAPGATDEDERATRESMDGLIYRLIVSITCVLATVDFSIRSQVMQRLLRLGRSLPNEVAELVIQYYAKERLLAPSNFEWSENCHLLVDQFFLNRKKSSRVREMVVQVLKEEYGTVDALRNDQDAGDYANLLLEQIPSEKDAAVLNALTEFALYALSSGSDDMFDKFLHLCRASMESNKNSQQDSPIQSRFPTWHLPNSEDGVGSPCHVLARACVKLFLRNVNTSSYRTKALYDYLLSVAGDNSGETDARISACKLLFRLRSDSNNAIFLISASESESIAAVLSRMSETAPRESGGGQVAQSHFTRSEERTASTREIRNISGEGAHTGASRIRSGRVTKPIPLSWLYPGLKGLPEEPPQTASHLLYSYLSDSDKEHKELAQLNTGIFLELVIKLLQQGPDWEVYSYILVHLAAQLTNKPLFVDAVQQIRILRGVICEQLRNQSFYEPPAHTSLKKADVAVCLLHILTILIGYHSHFTKSEEDDMVKAFYNNITHHDRAPKWCIHALAICCHELPRSITAHLSGILQRMQMIITQPSLAIHILEFLACLSRMPHLYNQSFTDNEFKIIFGMCIRYLQTAREKRDRDSNTALKRTSNPTLRQHIGLHEAVASMELESRGKGKQAQDDLPQYVYSLAYHVVTFWFLSVRMQDRHKHFDWLVKGLTYQDKDGRDVREDQAIVTIDFMQRTTYSDRDETAPRKNWSTPETDGEVLKKSWIVGHSIVTIETAGRTGLSQITRHRPSGTRYTIYTPCLTDPPPHQESFLAGISGNSYYSSKFEGVLPDDIIKELYSSYQIALFNSITPEEPIPLPEDNPTASSLKALDRTPSVDGHKIGVIYIADGQTTENEILANVQGTQDYTKFVSNLGTWTRIKDCKFNLHGLDRDSGEDGEATYCWRDRVSEIVFHVTTMMPTDLKLDPQSIRKKSHIGNNFVNIVFNNSGLPFAFDTFPSQFNYVYIVITPEARQSFVDSRRNPMDTDRYYKVQVMSQPGFPEISPAAEPKIISGEYLPAFVRLLALNASVFSQVWVSRSLDREHVSSWRNRLQEISRLRDRNIPEASRAASPVVPLLSPAVHSIYGPPPIAQTPRDSGVIFKRASAATFGSNATASSGVLGSTEMERSGSQNSLG